MQLAPAVQQGGGAVLNALDHHGEAGLVAVDVAVGEAVDLLLHQRLVVLPGEVEYSGRFYTPIPEIGNHRSDMKETAIPF